VDEHIQQFPWLIINMVNHYINIYQKGDTLPTVIDTHHQTVVPGITDSSPVHAAWLRTAFAPMVTSPSGTTLTVATKCDDSQGPSNRGGHPKGTTQASKKALDNVIPEALDECAVEFAMVLKAHANEKTLKHATGHKYRVPRGIFEEVINRMCNTYNLKKIEIKMKTILSRMNPNIKLRVKHRDMDSPMTGIETHLLVAILRLVDLHQPVSCVEGLPLASSLIDGTERKGKDLTL
jgi:hypothetical protein